MSNKLKKIIFIVSGVIIVLASFFVGSYFYQKNVIAIINDYLPFIGQVDQMNDYSVMVANDYVAPVIRQKPAKINVKGLYATAYSGSNDSKIDYYIDIAKRTEINAIVIDIKDSTGYVFYDSQVPDVIKYNAKKVLIKDLKKTIDKLHENGVYVIARQVVFQDPIAAAADNNLAVKSSAGGIWRDNRGLAWVDASNEDNWNYVLEITKEVISYGVDEINFDYIRFPSDGNISTMRFKNWNPEMGRKSVVMKKFFKFLYDNLKDEPAYLSVDLFGLTTERTDDMNIGQEIEDAALYFDFICPMVYPSHYPSGYLNFKNPAAEPYAVVYNAILKGIESLATVPENRAEIRPWLQDFDMGAVYTSSMVKAQIQASEKAGGIGYLIWDPRNDFTVSAFNLE